MIKDSCLTNKELVVLLDISPGLVGNVTRDGGLRLYHAKYKACLKALEVMDNKYKEGNWPAPRKARQTVVIELFISKTMWHSHIIKFFKKISEYPDMQLWLEEDDGAPNDLDLWGFEKSPTAYTFTDLGAYMGKEDKLRARKNKGNKGEKGKDKGDGKRKGKGKGKGKGKETDTDNM